MKTALLIIHGNGGHREQALRLLNGLQKNRLNCQEIISISEKGEKPIEMASESILVTAFRRKSKRAYRDIGNMLISSMQVVSAILRLRLKYNVRIAVSTGPGIAIPALLVCKFLFIKTVFLESWCRFESRTYSGAVCRLFVDKLYYSNKSLHQYYPKGEWSGRL